MATERHQHLERSQMELVDQHNRVWLVTTEIGTDIHRRPLVAPVGPYMPMFVAPYDFLPANKFLVYDPRRPSQLKIDYDAWIGEVRNSHESVHRELVQVATRLYKSEAARFIKEPTDEMREIVFGRGKGPEPMEPVLACKQGNGWILGLRPFDATIKGDVLLKPFLEKWVEVRYRDAASEDEIALASGLNFAEGQDELTDEELELATAPAAAKKTK